MIRNIYNLDRIEKQIMNFTELRYLNRREITEFRTATDDGSIVNPKPKDSALFTGDLKINDYWHGRDKYLWIKFVFTIPQDWKGKTIVGKFDFGRTGMGNNSGFESLLYLNDTPYQAVDSNHEEVFINSEEYEDNIEFKFRLWSGLEGGGPEIIQTYQFKTAFVSLFSTDTDDYYYLMSHCISTARRLPPSVALKYKLEDCIVSSYNIVDFTNQESLAFHESVSAALKHLQDKLASFDDKTDYTVTCIGHSHIDLAWLWRYKHTREKGVRSFNTVNRMLEQHPEYLFMQSSPQLYSSIKEDAPELYAKITRWVQENRWEASGAMWVEADCNIPNGESLARQLLYGKKYFKEEFGISSNYLWLPDVFGYSYALPQLLKSAGIDNFITTKISWNDMNRMPHDTFLWKGLDGSEVITHFITTPEVTADVSFYTYNGMITSETVTGVWENYKDKALNSNMLICYGYGDGGGGPTRDMVKSIESIKKIPGLPAVKTGFVQDYLDELNATVNENGEAVAVWDGELYFELHRGTYTSQARIKKTNRQLELKYRDAEIFSTLRAIQEHNMNAYPACELEKGWKLILKNQFHDIIPGSSIKEVYMDSAIEHQEADKIAEAAILGATQALVESDEDFTVFNTFSKSRKGLVKVDEKHSIQNGFALVEIQPFSQNSLESIICRETEFGSIVYMDNCIETDHLRVCWNEKGHLISVFFKKVNREVLSSEANLLEICEDRPRAYDTWELEPTLVMKQDIISDLVSAELIDEGPLFIKFKFTWKYNKSTINQILIVYSFSSRIDFVTEVDWHEKQKTLRTAFPVNIRSLTARYDIQFGNIERPTIKNTSWDEAKFETIGHQWADFSERGFGVALLNDCKYGYDIHGNVIRLSLLKSAENPDTLAEEGRHTFTYSLYPHSREWYDSELQTEAWDLNSPLFAVRGSLHKDLPSFKFDCKNTMIDAIKKSENNDGFVIRLHENTGGHDSIVIELPECFASWTQTNLLEEPIISLQNSTLIKYTLRPYEIVNFLVKLK
ncbi:MAG: alpha-mannosidase [Sphaerochaetaceae bacterium]|nr:alpha-mannosidase [Sphaerochaetaceae bacterium]